MNNNPMERPLAEVDPDIAQAIENEERRQHEGLELIASENFVSEAVLEAAGSVFTNKYAEGYPGKRYYGGCEFTDVVENLARDRAKQLFGAEHANVQPHSGSTANMAAYCRDHQAGRHHPRPEPGARRPPHARASAELLRQDLQDRPLRRDQGDRDHRLRRTGADRRARAAEAHRRRRQRLSAHHRFRPHAADRRQGRRALPGRHGALRRTGGRRRASFARAARARRHHDHAQDAARTARGHDSFQGRVRRGHRQSCLPRNAGRPAGAHHRGQGGLLPRGDAAGLQGLRAADRRQRQGAGADADRRRLPHHLRRYRHPPDAGERFRQGHAGLARPRTRCTRPASR